MKEGKLPDYEDDRPMILPLGGTREIGSHKGYGLALISEILGGGLSNNGLGIFRRKQTSHHFTVYNIDAFGSLDAFVKDVDEYLDRLKESKPAPGFERVLYAGLPEHEEEKERNENGIPYHPEVIDWFRSITSELNIKFKY
jgi:LDH2 family malate/lactate/ureidoglycolate dehydrogenase